jgi:hypothetical protein
MVQGFQTGDIVRALVSGGTKAGVYTGRVAVRVSGGTKAGVYTGRVAVRATGSFNITTRQGTVQGIPARSCRVIQRADGYAYQKGEAALPPQA